VRVHRSQAPVGRPRTAYRWPLKAASFRTWPGSRADIGRDPAIDAAIGALTTEAASLGREFSPARADCGYRAPLHPRL